MEKLEKEDKQHGAKVTFRVSEKYMGKGSVLPWKEMVQWLETLSYFIRKKKLTVTVDIFDGMELIESKKFKPKPFSELLDKYATNTSFSPKTSFSCDGEIKENIRKTIMDKKGQIKIKEAEVTKHLHLDVALRYQSTDEMFIDSYCNWTNTYDGGVHQNALEHCFCNYMQNKTKASMTENQREKTPILWDDVRSGLCCVLNLSTDAQVGFVGNAKTKIGEESLTPVLREMINGELDAFFSEHPSVLSSYISIIRLNAKARIEMQKVKTATQKEKMTSFKEHEMKNFIACTNKKKNEFREIFLVEGDSPAGAARNGSDPRTQAFFMFRGVTLNAWKCTLSQAMENKEYAGLVDVYRCGIGKSFDLSNFWFKRSNLFTDQDIDGFNISSGLLGFHYRFLPEIIEAGRLFKVYTPLYHINDPTNPFVINKAEMVELTQSKIIKNYKIKIGDIKFGKSDVVEFLNDTYDYATNLVHLAKNNGEVDKYLLEVIIATMVMYGAVESGDVHEDLVKLCNTQKFITYLMKNVQRKFPEMTYAGDNRVIGIASGKRTIVKINDRLLRKAADLIPVYRKYGYMLEVQEKKDNPRILTIGEFLDDTAKYVAKIIERYKGLGELNGVDLWKYSLDINHRISVQYTMKGIERELEIFKKVHGGTPADMLARKQMMMDYKIRRDDLDN